MDIFRNLDKKKVRVIGVMSGTSMDGMDISLVEFNGLDASPEMEVILTHCAAYDESIQQRIALAFNGYAESICRLNVDIAITHADAILSFLNTNKINPNEIDLIASHGQTIYHINDHSSLQIGDADIIAKKTNIPVIHDFRMADIACGGNGAPLVPFFDIFLNFPHKYSTAFQNLGGIGNVTFAPAGEPSEAFAFDTGPANILLDQLMLLETFGKTKMDRDGIIASQGTINQKLVDDLMGHPYFSKRPPKSTGHEDFGRQVAVEIRQKYPLPFSTIMRTVTRFVARSIQFSYDEYLPNYDRVIFSGGGVRNNMLMSDVKDLISSEKIINFEDAFNFESGFKESVAFAYLGYCRYRNIPSNVPHATGAKSKTSLGKLAFPN